MITSNAGAEFTTKTTIIVVVACLQRENMAAWLAQTVVLRCSKPPELQVIRWSRTPAMRHIANQWNRIGKAISTDYPARGSWVGHGLKRD
jgi:hypothetical protein